MILSHVRILIVFCITIGSLAATAQGRPSVAMTWTFSQDTLYVCCDYPASADALIVFSMSDWAGVPDYHRFVRNLTVKSADSVLLNLPRLDSATIEVNTAGRPFTVTYAVVCEKISFSGEGRSDCFHPTLFPEWAYLWGYSFLLLPDHSVYDKWPLKLAIDAGPYRTAFTSLNTADELTVDDLRESLTIAGDFRRDSSVVDRATVDFFIRGAFVFTDEEFRKAVTGIFAAQAKYIGNYPPGRRMVVLVEGNFRSTGGTVIKNAVALYPDPARLLTADGAPTLRLIAHEHFHVLGHQIGADSTRGEGYYKWFQEGLTEYYAHLTLYRERLYTGEDFIAALNRLTLDYLTNPFALTATADTLEERYWQARELNQLPYNKGAMIGFLIDLRIMMASGGRSTIDDFMRALAALFENYTHGGPTESDMIAVLDSLTGRSWGVDFDGWILGAQPLPLCEVARESGLACAPESVAVFDLGVKTGSEGLNKGDVLIEVAPHAAEAGLQPGDSLTGWSFYGGQPDKTATLKFRRGGEDKEVGYLPKSLREIVQLRADSATVQALERLRARTD